MPDADMEEPRPLQCSNRTLVGGAVTEAQAVGDKGTLEGIRRCGAAVSACSKKLDAQSGPEDGWSTALRNCEKNVPLSSFVPYTHRLSMLPVHMASHPLDILTDPGQKTHDSHPDGSEAFKTQDLPVVEEKSESSIRRAKPLVQISLSSDSETVKSGSRTSSESNLPSFHERVSIVEMMPHDFENIQGASNRQSTGIHGIMSTHFLPRRPLSQICSRTINASSAWKMGNALAEGLPHCHAPNSACCAAAAGNPWKSACNISAQIQAARSCSQRSFGSSLNNGTDRCEQQPPILGPSDLSVPGSSGVTSSAFISTISQASSSLDTSPTHKVALRGSVFSVQMDDGPRSRLSSFDRDFYLSTSARSRSSSFVSSVEEKQSVEIRKLRHEIELAKEKIGSLTTQLNMNVVLVTTYEQNLESMSERNQQLTTLLEEKSLELQRLPCSSVGFAPCYGESKSIPNYKDLQSSRRKSSSISNFPTDSKVTEAPFCRPVSSDSLNSQSSSCSVASQPCVSNGIGPEARKKSKKNWIRKSLSRAFSGKQKHRPYLTVELDQASMDSSPCHSDAAPEEKPSAPVGEADASDGENTTTRTFQKNVISNLKKQLRERDAELMDLKLEALSSVQQIEQLRATVAQLKKEIASQRSDQMKRQQATPGQSGPSSSIVDKTLHVATGNDVRKASIVSSSDLETVYPAVSTGLERSVDSSINGNPRLTTQESFIYSSPKFLHKFSLKSPITSISIDDCFLSAKPSNPSAAIVRRSSHREFRRDDKNNCHAIPKTNHSVDSRSLRCDSDRGDGGSIGGRKTLSPLAAASSTSDALRNKDINGCSKSSNSALLQSVV